MENNKRKILLCDGWNLLIGMNNASNVVDSSTMQIGMYLGTMNMIRTFVDKFKPVKIVFALDGPEAGERRRKLYSGYKAGRRVKAKTSSVTIQEGEDEYTKYASQGSFVFQLQRLYELCKLLPVSVVVVPYCEGDDLIAYLAEKNKDEYDCVIVSGDKDYCQLIQPGVSIYNWREKKYYDEIYFQEKFGISSHNYIFMKILLGDTSDEVKGVKGIGKETFKAAFNQLLTENTYDNVGEFIEAVKNMNLEGLDTRKRNAVKKLYEEDNVDLMYLLFQVMKLDENCLKLHHINLLRQQLEEQESKSCSMLQAQLMLQKHEFNRLYNGFNKEKWLQPFRFVKPGVKLNT